GVQTCALPILSHRRRMRPATGVASMGGAGRQTQVGPCRTQEDGEGARWRRSTVGERGGGRSADGRPAMIEPLVDLVDRVLAVVAGLDPLVLALTVLAFTALETTALIGTVVPGDVVVLLAGSTVDSPARFVLVAAAASAGTCLGDLVGYTIGLLVGPRVRVSRVGR